MNEPTNLSEWRNYIHAESNNPVHVLSAGDYKKPWGSPNEDWHISGLDLLQQPVKPIYNGNN